MTPMSKFTSCNRERDLVAVERLATRAYALHTFRCPSCASVLRLAVPTGIEWTVLTGVRVFDAVTAWPHAPLITPAADHVVRAAA
jgi:DNA-binding helix-hairpin-helix protein with protein kinase domain